MEMLYFNELSFYIPGSKGTLFNLVVDKIIVKVVNLVFEELYSHFLFLLNEKTWLKSQQCK